MKLNIRFFRGVIANVIIAAVVAGISLVGFTGGTVTASTDAKPAYKGSSADKVSLMFNVYQGTEYLDKILDALDEYGVKTTFFVGGCWVRDNEKSFKKIVGRGHEIGNHGFFHRDHAKLDARGNAEEINACHELVKSVSGVEMNLFAPPSGSYSRKTLDIADEKGYTTVMWSKDTIDWRDKDENVIFTRATKNVSGGDLILMHPTEATANVIGKVLCTLKERGLTVSPVSKVL